MIKRLVRACISEGCRGATLLASAERRASERLVILCYHKVLPTDLRRAYPFPDLVVTPVSFRQHCQTLKKHYDVLPLHEGVRRLRDKEHGARPLASITFDDGYRDNFEFAAPVLEETGLKATFFVVAGLAGTDDVPWYDKLANAVAALGRRGKVTLPRMVADLANGSGHEGLVPNGQLTAQAVVARAKRLAPADRWKLVAQLATAAGAEAASTPDQRIMDFGQLRALAQRGHEIGSHSSTHEILPQLDDASLEREVGGSRTVLEKELDRPVRSFCYPNGDVDARVASAVAKAGYTCAVTTVPGTNDPRQDAFRLRRRFIHEDRLKGLQGTASGTLLRMELSGMADRVFMRRAVAAS